MEEPKVVYVEDKYRRQVKVIDEETKEVIYESIDKNVIKDFRDNYKLSCLLYGTQYSALRSLRGIDKHYYS